MKSTCLFKLFILILFLIPISLIAQTDTTGSEVAISESVKTSLFDHLYNMEGNASLIINTNIKKLIRDKMAEVYQEANIQIPVENEKLLLELPAKIKTRGNMRKKVSYLPPVKIDFVKSALDSCGFLRMDDLKIVFPGGSDRRYQQLLFKEFLLYEIYALIDSNYMRTKLTDISISWKGKERYQFTGFLIEDKKEYTRRKNLHVIEKGKLTAPALDRPSFLKMLFFQYMIANTDWGVDARHNFEMVKLPNVQRAIAMPYDFDFSGFVGQHYAAADPRLGIENVHERFFYPQYKMEKSEYEETATYFLSIEKEIYTLCEKATYMEAKTRAQCVEYFKDFFELLKADTDIKEQMVKGH